MQDRYIFAYRLPDPFRYIRFGCTDPFRYIRFGNFLCHLLTVQIVFHPYVFKNSMRCVFGWAELAARVYVEHNLRHDILCAVIL